jgi:hypothetical protein
MPKRSHWPQPENSVAAPRCSSRWNPALTNPHAARPAPIWSPPRVGPCGGGLRRPDPRTAGSCTERHPCRRIAAELADSPESRASLEGYLMQRRHGRPHDAQAGHLADGCIALASGESQWITPEARAHTHAMRARADAIWWVAAHTAPMRRSGCAPARFETRSPERWVLTHGAVAEDQRCPLRKPSPAWPMCRTSSSRAAPERPAPS